MTTYRDISDTEVQVDAPLTQQLMQALKDNPEAIAQAASGATRIDPAALEKKAMTVGNYVIGQFNIGSTSGADKGGDRDAYFKFRAQGTVRLTYRLFYHSYGGFTESASLTIYKSTDNGANYTSIHTSDILTGGDDTTEDEIEHTFNVNDRVRFGTNAGGAAGISAYGFVSVGDSSSVYGVQCARLRSIN